MYTVKFPSGSGDAREPYARATAAIERCNRVVETKMAPLCVVEKTVTLPDGRQVIVAIWSR